ncbi:MAG: hypothetical protein HYS59_01750 [Candidatus Vogelbacteria bacterium]|nr:hypothetical protein [Candidatus Vogelbacteria bacterium]
MALFLVLLYISLFGVLFLVYRKMAAIREREGISVRSTSGFDQLAQFTDKKVRSTLRAIGMHITPILARLNAWVQYLTYHAAEKSGRQLTRLSRVIRGKNMMRDNRGATSLFLRNLNEHRKTR